MTPHSRTSLGLLMMIIGGLVFISCEPGLLQRGPFSFPINLPQSPEPNPIPTAIQIEPQSISLTAEGEEKQLHVTLLFSNSDTRDITADATYQISDSAVAEVSAGGVVTPVENGSATATVTYQSFTAATDVTVDMPPPTLLAMLIEPDVLIFDDPAQRQQLQVFGIYSRGPDRDLTDPASGTAYSIDRVEIARVDSAGQLAPVARGEAQITVVNSDIAADAPVLVTFCRPLSPVLDPHPTMTNLAAVTLAGQCEVGSQVEIFGPAASLIVPVDATGRFSVDVPLAADRSNTLFVTNLADCNDRSSPTTAAIIRDNQPPFVYIDFPTADQVEAASTDVAGRVSDLLSGFLNLDVSVNGLPAIVNRGIGTNGTFFLPALPLEVGSNTITVVATDAVGNTAQHQISITRAEIPPDSPLMMAVSGNEQSARIHENLPDPIVVKVTKADGVTPFANKVVTFEVTRSDSRLFDHAPLADEAGTMVLQVRTDANGLATVYWKLGGGAGSGNSRVQVSSTSIAGTVAFCASTLPGPAAQINIGTGNNQRAEVGSVAPEPLRTWVSDSCNGIPNVDVTFTVTRGGGKVIGPDGVPLDSVVVPTSDTGHAQIQYLLGPEVGNNFVEAQFIGNPTGPATFVAYGLARAPTAASSRGVETPGATFSGMIQDNGNQPLGGAGVRLHVNGQDVGNTTSLPNGSFLIENIASAGKADLFIDSATINTLNGGPVPAGMRFPDMHYETHVVPNATNSLPMAVMLPPLNTANDRIYHWNQSTDLELTCEGMEGLKLIVKAGTTITLQDGVTKIGPTYPPEPGNPERPGQITLALNQVHHDNVPMPMPDGAAPPFAWTFQPAQAHFDIPVQIEYPNMSGLPAGAETYFLSFNHETNKFEIIASGAVSDDGSKSTSDPGQGITVSGWGCNCPPYSVTSECKDNGCNSRAADYRAYERSIPSSDPRDFFANSLACVGEGLCAAAASGRFEDPDWMLGLNRALYERWRMRDSLTHWRFMEFDCSLAQQLLPPAGAKWVCFTDFVIAHDVVDMNYALGQVGCGTEEDWDTIGQIVRECSPASLGGLAQWISSRLSNVRLDCLFGGTIELPPRDNLLRGAGIEAHLTDPSGQPVAGAQVGMVEVDIDALVEMLVSDATGVARFPVTSAGRYIVFAYSSSSGGAISEILTNPTPGLVVDLELQANELPVPTGASLLDNLCLSLGGQSIQAEADGSYNLRNVSAADVFGAGGPGTAPDFLSDEFLRVTGVSTIGDVTYYAFSDFFQLRSGQIFEVENLTLTDTAPLSLAAIQLTPALGGLSVLTNVGETTQLQTLAILSDGTEGVDVTPRTSWTIYRTSNPAVATVGPNGLVTAQGRGTAFITASNEGATAVTRIVVAPGDPLTTVEGFVFFPDGSPADGAQITTFPVSFTGFTDSDGRYSIPNVPTTFGALQVSASIRVENVDFAGRIENVQVAPGLITDAGVISLVEGGIGGPIILGGDDLTDHGSVDGNGVPEDGWLYIQRAIEDLRPEVFRFGNDGTIAALGSGPSSSICCDAGAGLGVAAAAAGIQVNYYNGAAAIDQFFADLSTGVANPAIIWVAGTGAANDLDFSEGQRLTAHAAEIASFTDSGGGLMAHGSGPDAYGWLTTLVPTIEEVQIGGSNDLVLTPDGIASFPGLTNQNVNAGPWHSYFQGSFGGLKILVESTQVNDDQGCPAAVIIGGKLVEFR